MKFDECYSPSMTREAPNKTDIDLTTRDVVDLSSPDAIAALLAKLGYNTGSRAILTPEAVGLSGDSASAVKRIELLSEDPEGFLRVVFAQTRSLTAKFRNDLSRVLGKTNFDHLLILASDFDMLEFVLLDKHRRENRGPAGGERIQVVPKTIGVNRRASTRLDLRTLRRFTWTGRDALEQFDKLRNVFDSAEYIGKYFQNRGLFSDHFLLDRLREDPAWRENPSEIFSFVRDLVSDAQIRWGGKAKATLRDQLLEPLFKQLGFLTKVTRAGKNDRTDTDPTKPDYLLKAGEGRTLTAAFVYAWDRWLDGPDLSDADTPDENPGACVVTALDEGIADWIIVTNGKLWRLYSRHAHARSTNFYEVDLIEAITASGDTDPNEAFRYWWLFLRPEAFTPRVEGQGCLLDVILNGSREYAKRLGDRLKERIFLTIFPHLAQGFLVDLNRRLGVDARPTDDMLADTFEATLTLLYRLLFLLYAESRDLLPIREAPYQAASLKTIKEEIADRAGGAESEVAERLRKAYSANDTTLFDRLCKLFQAMDKGDPVLNVPSYNGGLFNTSPDESDRRDQRIARFLLDHKIPDLDLALAIDRLARDQDERSLELVFIDFKSLEVRHLGSIYEGLLEFKLKVADEDLTTQAEKKSETYIPLSQAQTNKTSGRRKPASVVVQRGQVYLSNDKLERKASGSYYTPDSIVEYIVAHTVGPVLEEKLEALRPEFRKVRKTFDNELQKSKHFPSPEVQQGGMDHREWSIQQSFNHHRDLIEKLFDLKVLDPAMGSGHFLVEVVDFVTDRLLKFLNQFPINPVNFAIDNTRKSIIRSLGEQGVAVDPDKLTDINLIKRHVLKRCIYGVDLNPMAVELAKVSLWLDAFTLGAPLNFLDHHLRCGNSLIGATFEDLENETSGYLFKLNYEPLLRAIKYVLFVSKIADATAAEVADSQRRYLEARRSLAGYQIVLDLLVARHFGEPKALEILKFGNELDLSDPEKFEASLADDGERNLVAQVEALARRPDRRFFHWEIEFPEVFFGFVGAGQAEIKHKDKIKKGSAGFDCVVGNPPYVRSERLDSESKKFFSFEYNQVYDGKADIYFYFISTAHSLNKRGGRKGLIISNAWLQTNSGKCLRKWLTSELSTLYIIDFETIRPFEDADMRPSIILASKGDCDRYSLFTFAAPSPQGDFRISQWKFGYFNVNKQTLQESCEIGWSLDRLSSALTKNQNAFDSCPTLVDVAGRIYSGIKPGATEAFVIPSTLASLWIEENPLTSEIARPFFRGHDLQAYYYQRPKDYILLVTNEEEFRRVPRVRMHLEANRTILESRDEVRRGASEWFSLRPCDYYDVFSKTIIAWPDTAKTSRFCELPPGSVIGNTAFCIRSSYLWLLPILNSQIGLRLVTILCQSRDERAGSLRYRLLPQYMARFPVPTPEGSVQSMLEEVAVGKLKHNSEIDRLIESMYAEIGIH